MGEFGGFSFERDSALVGQARRWLAASLQPALGGEPTGAHVIDDAVVIASELVTNAIQAECGHGTLSWQLRPGALALPVADDAPGWPTLQHPGPSDVHGRGLHIVRSLAAETGFRTVATGKEVWATVTVPTPRATRARRSARRRGRLLARRQPDRNGGTEVIAASTVPDFDVRLRDLAANDVLITVTGELDLHSRGSLAASIQNSPTGTAGDVVLDLADLRFCDAAGIETLVAARDHLARAGRRLRIINATRRFRHIADLAQAGFLFDTP
jgi:anti-anti-sigma factor